MMNGVITPDREAAMHLLVRGPKGQEADIEAVIDTGFNGLLALPDVIVGALGLAYHSASFALLADGSGVFLRRFEATVVWHGLPRDVLVLEADGGPLLGMSLLYGNRLTMDILDGGFVQVDLLP